MSGVSVDQNTDLQALVRGGDAFLKRLAQFKDAKETFDASFAALSLGRDAKSAYEDAKATQAVAAKMVTDAEGDAAGIILNAEAQAREIVDKANQEAAALITAAQRACDADKATLASEIASARETLERAQVEHNAKLKSDRADIIELATKLAGNG